MNRKIIKVDAEKIVDIMKNPRMMFATAHQLCMIKETRGYTFSDTVIARISKRYDIQHLLIESGTLLSCFIKTAEPCLKAMLQTLFARENIKIYFDGKSIRYYREKPEGAAYPQMTKLHDNKDLAHELDKEYHATPMPYNFLATYKEYSYTKKLTDVLANGFPKEINGHTRHMPASYRMKAVLLNDKLVRSAMDGDDCTISLLVNWHNQFLNENEQIVYENKVFGLKNFFI